MLTRLGIYTVKNSFLELQDASDFTNRITRFRYVVFFKKLELTILDDVV